MPKKRRTTFQPSAIAGFSLDPEPCFPHALADTKTGRSRICAVLSSYLDRPIHFAPVSHLTEELDLDWYQDENTGALVVVGGRGIAFEEEVEEVDPRLAHLDELVEFLMPSKTLLKTVLKAAHLDGFNAARASFHAAIDALDPFPSSERIVIDDPKSPPKKEGTKAPTAPAPLSIVRDEPAKPFEVVELMIEGLKPIPGAGHAVFINGLLIFGVEVQSIRHDGLTVFHCKGPNNARLLRDPSNDIRVISTAGFAEPSTDIDQPSKAYVDDVLRAPEVPYRGEYRPPAPAPEPFTAELITPPEPDRELSDQAVDAFAAVVKALEPVIEPEKPKAASYRREDVEISVDGVKLSGFAAEAFERESDRGVDGFDYEKPTTGEEAVERINRSGWPDDVKAAMKKAVDAANNLAKRMSKGPLKGADPSEVKLTLIGAERPVVMLACRCGHALRRELPKGETVESFAASASWRFVNRWHCSKCIRDARAPVVHASTEVGKSLLLHAGQKDEWSRLVCDCGKWFARSTVEELRTSASAFGWEAADGVFSCGECASEGEDLG